ncbi:YHS domain-containing (seleno)protein [Rhizobium etli]|uniref:YHS domain-containing protein n=1 Tax=Rhizobium etli TaxID=29449 RepID=A0A7W6ZGN3_RHIET|nr:YHS domain-containing (seleno)protein [Rhizobium etli]MBB4480059.1 YHS domain-containing protein [Rhizobium etli]MBB4535616.1 YHS domain-containing protein [Rhizobium etli]
MTQTVSFAAAVAPFAAAPEGQIREFAMHNVPRRSAIGLVLAIAAALFATSMPSFATEAVPLAIKGYDPVAYFTIGSPTRGLPEIEYEWDEHRYLFANAEHRELFKADPVRYAPEFGNFCAMALALGELDEANPEYWLISDGKLYIFGKPAPMGPALFQHDLAANIAKANQNRGLLQEH